ncbi:hypothetical protein Tco_0067935 [Tanacetum coccineum]
MHEKTKHFDIDVHLVREKVASGLIKTEKVDSKGQVADILTKALGTAQHTVLSKKIGLVNMVLIVIVGCWWLYIESSGVRSSLSSYSFKSLQEKF